MTTPIKHPLPNGTKVRAKHKTCACAGGKFKDIEGTVLKTIVNHSGTWYYLNTGITVRAESVVNVV